MPRLSTPDPLAATVGQRIQALRREKQLTLEQLANRTRSFCPSDYGSYARVAGFILRKVR